MKAQKDTRYFIPSLQSGEYKNDLFFKTFEAEIKEYGFFILRTTKGTVKVYNAEQAFILSNRSLQVENCDTKETVTLDCFPYLKSFIDGYQEGEAYFKNDFKATPGVMFGENSENYIRTILNHFYKTEWETFWNGWNQIRFVPCSTILTHKVCEKYGKYSGIVNQVQELIKQYPEPFKKVLDTYFLAENEDENEDENINETIANIEKWLFEFKKSEQLTEQNYNTLVMALVHYFEHGSFPILEKEIKVSRINKKRLGWHLNKIFEAEGKGIEIELLQFAKENISLFKDMDFDVNNHRKSNLYKYFTQNV